MIFAGFFAGALCRDLFAGRLYFVRLTRMRVVWMRVAARPSIHALNMKQRPQILCRGILTLPLDRAVLTG